MSATSVIRFLVLSLGVFVAWCVVSGIPAGHLISYTQVLAATKTPSPTPTIRPITTSSISAQSVQGSNGWYTSAVTVTLTATASSQIKNIKYWLDSNPVTTVPGANTIQTFPQNGSHVLSYYSTDVNNLAETPVKTLSFKVDSVAPYNWRNFNALQVGNNHTFIFSIQVDDTTSGLDASNGKLQYSVDAGATWGYYSNLTPCQSGNWVPNGWLPLLSLPFVSGAKTGTLVTLPVDVCNSNWDQCKIIRFKETDMAGLSSEKKICLNGSWMTTTKGDVYSLGNIDMDPTINTSGSSYLLQSGGQISNFSSANNWNLNEYDRDSTLGTVDYAHLSAKLPNQISGLPSGKLPKTSGVYAVSGGLTISSSTIPTGYSTTSNIATILLVSGNVSIDTNIDLPGSSTLMIVTNGDIEVDRNVTSIDALLVTSGSFASCDTNGNNCNSPLLVTGAVYAANGFSLSRDLGSPGNNNGAAETFTYQPSYLVNPTLLALLYGERQYSWNERIDY